MTRYRNQALAYECRCPATPYKRCTAHHPCCLLRQTCVVALRSASLHAMRDIVGLIRSWPQNERYVVTGRLTKATAVWSQEIPRYSESLWLCRAGFRPSQSLWELRVLVDAGCIHLLLGEIFCSGFDHGAGHPLLFLDDAKAPNCQKNNGFNGLGKYSEWPKVAGAVIQAFLLP